MATPMIPFNIDLLYLSDANLKMMRPVTSLDIFTGATKDFNPDGLFSVDIFGKYGDAVRSKTFAYIDLGVGIIHPLLYKAITDLKELYGGIMMGTAYAVWDDSLKDFIKSDQISGQTGYSFFINRYQDIVFEPRPSIKRELNIKLVNKYSHLGLIDKIIVLPAGLRDYEIDEQSKPTEDEINPLYRALIAYSNLITSTVLKTNPESVDSIRANMQIKFIEIYNYIKSLLEGKKKLILGKWASRNVFYGTRNVITSMDNYTGGLGSHKTIGFNQSTVGLFQYIKGILPIAMYSIKSGFVSQVFTSSSGPATLVNEKTLKKEHVTVNSDYYDLWMSNEGLEKTINKFAEESVRHKPIKIGKYYLGLCYKGGDGTFKFFHDIDDLPDGFDAKLVSPITFCELIYAAVYKDSTKYPGFLTRYPITGYGSTYPCKTYLKTTVKSRSLYQLDDNWERTDSLAIEWPVEGSAFVNSLSPAPAHIKKLGADYDGDMCSYEIAITDEAVHEVDLKLNSRNYYVDSNGNMYFSASDDIIDSVLNNITQ